jgi:small subunit ribosomal protein S21
MPRDSMDKIISGLSVTVKNDNVEQAIRRLKKKVASSGKLQEVRDREQFEKPTIKRKRKKAAAKNRWRKKLASEQLPRKLY